MKKFLSLAVASTMLLSSFAFAAEAPGSMTTEVKSEPHIHTVNSGGFDLGIANDEKLIQMLKDNGTIDEDATPKEAEKALQKFLKNKMKNSKTEDGELEKEEEKLLKEQMGKMYSSSTLKGNGLKKGHTKKNNVPSVKEESWDGGTRTDNVLAILIDFPDYPHNSITPEETDMYYPEYTKEHFEEMIFGENGYTGPNGENFTSVKQYYEEQSGGSYTIEGSIAGWYTAKHPAAYYGGNDPAPDGSDANPRELVYEALLAAAADPNVDLSQFDQEDRYDLDGDGDYREPDGLIDHIMIFHAGVGEEAGGGNLGGDAIWSHRWNLGGVAAIPGTEAEVDYWGGTLAAYDYTIEPEDGAAGVVAHEYGHDLGLPDEYDTQYTGAGEPVSYWSIMSSGSWAGKIGGTEPTGFSPWCKEFLQASMPGSNWQTGAEVHIDDITSEGISVLLDQANSKGTNNDVLKINLPDKENVINAPFSGEYEYFSGSGNDLDNSMTTTIDLTNATNATLKFKAWYQIEQDWDYASIKVNGETISGNITTTTDPHEQNPGHGITGHSDGWIDAEFDLTPYVGQEITLELNYWTDVAAVEPGFYADDITVTVDGETVLFDDAEGDSLFTLSGFDKNTGKFFSAHYYLVEWRNHEGVDAGLGNIKRGNSIMKFDPGMLVWYADDAYDNNWTGVHPGEGFIGVVDADQHGNYWSDKEVASTRYQVHDAAFSIEKSEKMFLDYKDLLGITMKDNYRKANPLFNDGNDYSNPDLVDAGRNIPNYGLKIRVIGESKDRTVGNIVLYK